MKVQELETLLQQEKSKSLAQLEGEQNAKIENLEQEHTNLKRRIWILSRKELEQVRMQYQKTEEQRDREAREKRNIKEKLAKEILRLRAERIRLIRENWKDAENRAGCKEDYEAVREAVSEAQFKITEYVNIINKTQESLGKTYSK